MLFLPAAVGGSSLAGEYGGKGRAAAAKRAVHLGLLVSQVRRPALEGGATTHLWAFKAPLCSS